MAVRALGNSKQVWVIQPQESFILNHEGDLFKACITPDNTVSLSLPNQVNFRLHFFSKSGHTIGRFYLVGGFKFWIMSNGYLIAEESEFYFRCINLFFIGLLMFCWCNEKSLVDLCCLMFVEAIRVLDFYFWTVWTFEFMNDEVSCCSVLKNLRLISRNSCLCGFVVYNVGYMKHVIVAMLCVCFNSKVVV